MTTQNNYKERKKVSQEKIKEETEFETFVAREKDEKRVIHKKKDENTDIERKSKRYYTR